MEDPGGYFLLANGMDPADIINDENDQQFVDRGWSALEPGGVWGLTVCARNDVINKDEASVAWQAYRSYRPKNAGYAGPDLFDGDIKAYFGGIRQQTMYDAGAGWIIRAWHADPRVEPHWVSTDRFTRPTLELLLCEIDDASRNGDKLLEEAQVVCQEVKEDLEFPEDFWLAVRTAPRGRRFGKRGIALVFNRFDHPKRNRAPM